MMTKRRYILLLPVLMLFGLSSCLNEMENEDGEQGLPVTITISTDCVGATRATHQGSIQDRTIGSFRVLIYSAKTKELAFSSQINPNNLNPAEIQMKSGTYDFVFIANEHTDASLSTALDNIAASVISYKSALSDLWFSASAFETSKNIPMVTIHNNVIVSEDDKVKAPCMGAPVDVWEVEMERLGVRIDLELEMSEHFASAATLSFANVPSQTYLIQKENIPGATTTKTISVTPASTATSIGKKLKWERVILPESWFSSTATAANGAEVCLTNSGDTKKARIGLNPPGDYTLPRNNYIYISGSVTEIIDFTAYVQKWYDIPVNTEFDGTYFMSLSANEITLPSGNSSSSLLLKTNFSTWNATLWNDAAATQPFSGGWLSVSPNSGTANTTGQTILLTAQKNTGDTRTCYVKFTSGNGKVSLTVKVTQQFPAN